MKYILNFRENTSGNKNTIFSDKSLGKRDVTLSVSLRNISLVCKESHFNIFMQVGGYFSNKFITVSTLKRYVFVRKVKTRAFSNTLRQFPCCCAKAIIDSLTVKIFLCDNLHVEYKCVPMIIL